MMLIFRDLVEGAVGENIFQKKIPVNMEEGTERLLKLFLARSEFVFYIRFL